jgi:hypothetical protein
MHTGTTINDLAAEVNRVLNLDTSDVDARLAEVDQAFAQVQRDMLRASTPAQFNALAILEFSLLTESQRLRDGRATQ